MAKDHPRVLVVEDEFIIALDLSETVRDLGYLVDGPYADKENAFIAIDQAMPDLAILDNRPESLFVEATRPAEQLPSAL